MEQPQLFVGDIVECVYLGEGIFQYYGPCQREAKTGKQMCEAIVEAGLSKDKDGHPLSAEQLWNLSPTGELSHVFYLYEQAKVILKARSEHP